MSIVKTQTFVLFALYLHIACSAQELNQRTLDGLFVDSNQNDFPGCVVAASVLNAKPQAFAWGQADLEHHIANTTSTVFEAGSVSKQFTAAAVLLLVQRHQVGLDDAIHYYFPELPKDSPTMTVRNLLNHTSGLRDWGDLEEVVGWPRTTREYTQDAVLKILEQQHELNYPPGTAWSYTNSGFNLLALLVERVSGDTFEGFMQREFFVPLHMKSTRWRTDFRAVVPDRAIAYEREGSEWRQDMPFEDTVGHGGLLTTVGDLLLWNNAILSGSFHPAIFQTMTKPTKLIDGRTVRYGFGLFLSTFGGTEEISHDGATAGYRAWLAFYPQKKMSISVLCNADLATPEVYGHRIAGRLLGAVVNGYPPAPSNFQPGLYVGVHDHRLLHVSVRDGSLIVDGVPTRIPGHLEGTLLVLDNPVSGEQRFARVEPWTPPNLQEFVGRYSSTEANATFDIEMQGGKLIVHRGLAPDLSLDAAYEDTFEFDSGTIAFLRDHAGKVNALRVSTRRVWDLRFNRNL